MLNLKIYFELRGLKIFNNDTKNRKLLKYIISGLVIGLKCIASRIYNQINEKNTIYLNFMNNIKKKLSNIEFCNRNQKFRTFIDNNLSRFASDQQSVVNVHLI